MIAAFEAAPAVTNPGLLAAFAGGVLSFASPCVLPLVPGYLSLISGISGTDLDYPEGSQRGRLLGNALLFVAGFTTVFIAYGAAASALGSALAPHRDLLTRLAGGLIVFMGLVVAGVLRSDLLLRERRFHVSPSRLGPYAAPVMGMAFAFGWTPCIGPVLAGVLTLAAGRETLNDGVALLAVYGLGLGVPFVVMSVAFGRWRSTWEFLRRHGKAIDRVSGGLLVVFGLVLLTGQLGRLSSAVVWFWALLGLDRLSLG